MKTHHALRALALAALLLLAPELDARALADPTPGSGFLEVSSDLIEKVDAVFGSFDSARTPGCAVAVAREGQPVLKRAYGMANLEVGVANAVGTIFEAGSVSKQFTAAAVVLLDLDGALSLDDDVRKHIPELPDYGSTITLRHMLTHTSGLRDWGSVASISGWDRGSRTHTHDHVLDILGRQSALNFEPGHQYSYSNSGYNLLAIIVDRVSGMPFADFSRERIFEPLGLHQTQWRDDYRRIVPGRSSAYSPAGDGFRINHPIEDVHGNGGLLTTVDDLLAWNEHLRQGTLGAGFMAEMHTRGVLNSGETIAYAGGLQFGSQNGAQRISHTGATAGYRAYLALFPDEALSVALLCNVTSANPGGLGASVADLFLASADGTSSTSAPGRSGSGSASAAGMAMDGIAEDRDPNWADGFAAAAPAANGDPRWEDGSASGPPARDFGGDFGSGDGDGTRRLSDFVGTYHSDDAETTLTLALEDGVLFMHRRPATRMRLRAGDTADTFSAPIGSIRFIRDASQAVTEFSLRQDRVHDMRFHRVGVDVTAPED